MPAIERQRSSINLFVAKEVSLVGAAGFEPATLGLEIRCSIRLSYAPAQDGFGHFILLRMAPARARSVS